MKANKLISILSYFEYRKIRSGVTQIINNNLNKNVKNSEYLIDKYSKTLYNSNLVNRYTKLKYNKKINYFNKLRMKLIRLKYNVFNYGKVKSNNYVVVDYLINILIKLLSKLNGFNKPLEFNTESDKLNKVEKWAINFIKEEQIASRISPEYEKLLRKKEREIAKRFYFGIKHRDDEEEFVTDIENVANDCFANIKGSQLLHKMGATGDFYANYSKNEVKPKRKSLLVEYFRNISKRFNSKWDEVKNSRAKAIIANMKKRMALVKYNMFKNSLGRKFDEKYVIALYNAVDLNKRVMSIH